MLNRCEIIGNLGKEPEMSFTPDGKPATKFSVAVNMDYKDTKHTEWFNVVTWGKQAENCNQYLNKGSKVYVAGRLKTSSWEGNDGNMRYKTELTATEVIFLDSKPKTGYSDTDYIEPDDIPF